MDLKEYFINPGELIFSKHPVVIKTILGSCVSVVLFDKVNHYGGLCHFLLPESPDGSVSTKFGNVAVKTLINKFYQAGSKTQFLEASVIGGAFIIFDEKEIFFIGDRNSDMADKILKKNQIRIKSMNIGGEYGRKLVYNTYTNKMLVETMHHLEIEDLYRK